MTEEDEVYLVQLAQIASIAIENLVSTQAREANRLKDEFLATLSHELRSPLNAILGWIRLLRSDKLPEDDVTRALEVIERNVNWQTKLIEDLLDVSRITAGKMELNIRPVPTAAAMQSVIDTMQPIAKKRGVQLEAALTSSAKVLMGDPDRFQQAVMNLLDNAIKFTPAGGRVNVGLENTDDGVRITVADTGKGIPPQFLPHVFDRFRQADSTTTRVYGGLGIGLAVVRHIVELHGGRIRVESPGEGQGATFIVELPLQAIAPVDGQARAVAQEHATPAQWLRDLSGMRVLLVDDEPDARNVIGEILTRCGAEVRGVASAKEAMESFRKSPPDVLISDISMPHEDGYALIKAVRTLKPDEGGNIPAVALTAFAGQVDRSRLLASGFQMHLPKPIDPTQLPSLLAGLRERTALPLPLKLA
jgi:CheY-like chemotaxis protein